MLLTAEGVRAEGTWDPADTDVLDLVPPDLPTRAALDLLATVDPAKYATDVWARGVSAGQAILVKPDLAETPPDPADPTEFTNFVRKAKEHVHQTVDLAVAPGLKAGPQPHRTARLRQNGKRPALWVAGSVIGYAATAAAVITAWPWGLIAAVAYCAHPALVFAKSPLRPKDLAKATLLRPVLTPLLWYQTLADRWRSTQEREQAQRLKETTPWYEEALTKGTARFFEPRKQQCPACDSKDLRQHVKSEDLVQRKPGEFTMDRCVRCGHVWQNPRLTEEGLGFYYRDFYDGLGEGAADAVFSGKTDPYYGRARMVTTNPKRWLDIGSGHAHFCLAAKEVLPQTTFDGLDQGAAIEDAATKGRIEKAYRGSFKEFAPELRGQYDVISMHHYLEHVRDPWEELDIAADVLPDGGHLLIELPDPEWRLGRIFGRYWMPWFQPQHQHMMPIENLKHELAERGLHTVAVERGEAHLCNDFMLAALLFLGAHAPRTPAPWRPQKPRLKTIRSAAVWTFGIPLFLVAALLDSTINRAIAKYNDRGNAYRLLARKGAE